MTNNIVAQLRKDTASNFTTNNPTLESAEIGFETDTNKFKVGDGSTAWNSLDYAGGGGTPGGFMYGLYKLSADQTSNISLGNHIEFDTVEGSLDDLSTGSGQENGIITLPAGKTYKISGGFRFLHSDAGYTYVKVYNRTDSEYEGFTASGMSNNGTSLYTSQPTLLAIITTSVDTDIDVRFTGVNDSSTVKGGYSWLLIEEYAGY